MAHYQEEKKIPPQESFPTSEPQMQAPPAYTEHQPQAPTGLQPPPVYYQQGAPAQPFGNHPVVQPPQVQLHRAPVVQGSSGSTNLELIALALSLGLCLLGSPCALFCTVPAYFYAKKARHSAEKFDQRDEESNQKQAKRCLVWGIVCAVVAFVMLMFTIFALGIVGGVLRGLNS